MIKKVETKVKTSFEDVEGLLNNLLMLTTFTLGFSISFIAAFEYGALAEIDVRYYKLHTSVPGGGGGCVPVLAEGRAQHLFAVGNHARTRHVVHHHHEYLAHNRAGLLRLHVRLGREGG